MDINLKQRLMAAIVILALIVIFVPMLFHKHEESQIKITHGIPLPPKLLSAQELTNLPQKEALVEGLQQKKSTEEIIPHKQEISQLPQIPATEANQPEQMKQNQVNQQNTQQENQQTASKPSAGASASETHENQTTLLPKKQDMQTPMRPIKINIGDVEKEANHLLQQLDESKGTTAGQQNIPNEKIQPKGLSQQAKTERKNSVLENSSLSRLKETKQQKAPVIHAVSANKPQHPLDINSTVLGEPLRTIHVRGSNANSENMVPPVSTIQKDQLKIAKTYDQAWIVQLGSFANQNNVKRLVKKLRHQGFTVFGYTTKNGQRKITRVYVGPAVEKAEAQAMSDRLMKLYKIKGIVVKFDATNLQ